MAKQKKAQRRLDPEDVLEGRARPAAQEILALIHDVNPSGHDLPARESARRYALKSRLQSLLVRRFPDEIVVEPGEAPGVVGLRHRSSGADACHAVVASLDDDARSWVQMRIDLGDDEPAPSSAAPRPPPDSVGPPSDAPLDELSTGELLSRGRAALTAYDYDAARERFSAALDRGSREAAPLLLTVLVEHLALDADALSVEGRLDAEALRRSDVRVLLALAAARGYERDRAVRLVRADEGDAAAEVFVALGRGALERGDLEHAARDAAEVQRRAPSHPALIELSSIVKKRRAEERAPLEAEAQRLLDEGRVEEAEASAAALAARWPESAVAHAVTRTIEDRRRRAQARAMAIEGRAALDRGESAPALTLLRRAVALGLSGDDAEAAEKDMQRAEAAERAREAREKAADVARVLREGHLARGLGEYAALEDGWRDVVRRTAPLPELFYLDQTGVHGTGPEVRSAVQAVLALRRGLAILNGDPARALDILHPHRAVLQGIEHGAQALQAAQALVDESNRATADRRLMEAMEILRFDPGKGEAAMRERLTRGLKVLASIRREHLDEEGQDLVDRLNVTMGRMAERWDRARLVRKLRGEGNLMGARDALEELIRFEEAGADPDRPLGIEDGDEPGPPQAYDWPRQRDEVVRALMRNAAVRVAGPPGPDARLGQEAPRLWGVPTSVLPGGREIVLAEAHGAHIFFHVLDAAEGRVTRRASLTMTHDVSYARLQQRAGRPCLLGRAGMMDVDPSTWEPRRALEVAFTDGKPDDAIVTTNGRFLWFMHTGDDAYAAYSSYDVDRGDYGKAYGAEAVVHVALHPLLGLPEPRVLVLKDTGVAVQYEPRGSPVSGTQRPMWALPHAIVAHPRGEGLFALVRDPEEPVEVTDAAAPLPRTRVRWTELDLNGAPRRTEDDRTIEGLDPEAPYQVAAALDDGMAFALYTTHAGDRRLIGVGPRAGAPGLEQRFGVEVPPRLTLAQDAEARTVLALSPHEGGVEVVRLGASPPAFRAPAPRLDGGSAGAAPLGAWVSTATPLRPCAPRDLRLWVLRSGGYHLPEELLTLLSADARKGMIEGAIGERGRLVPRHALPARFRLQVLADEVAAAAKARYPGDPEMAQIPALRSALAGDWAAVRALLSPIDPAPLGDAAAQHHDHLLGVAHLMTGDVEEARRLLARGAARAGCCDLSIPLALVGLDPAGGSPSPAYAAVRTLDHAVRAADARLAAGDFAGARQALSGLVVREAREVQTLARLARAWLSDAAVSDTFARRLALAVFRSAHAEKKPALRRELPFPGARWDKAKLDALSEEAQRLLESERQERVAGRVDAEGAPSAEGA